MTLLSIGKAPLISLQWVLGGLRPLSTLISGSRGLEVVGALNYLALQGKKSLSSWQRTQRKLWLSREKHGSY
jgi:hypothetical protein